ncbi:hypothetical protein HMPREF0972_01583 [Actinomyces sp. oral taxon 848 str. F0332]|nr:hypothetical protein HMPREF0972_01583 [Actinomyces sp. oral taxon 848 str. F0332]
MISSIVASANLPTRAARFLRLSHFLFRLVNVSSVSSNTIAVFTLPSV